MFKSLFSKFQLFPSKKNGFEKLNLPLEIEKIIIDYKVQLESNSTYEEIFKKSLDFQIKEYNYYSSIKASREDYSSYTQFSFIGNVQREED